MMHRRPAVERSLPLNFAPLDGATSAMGTPIHGVPMVLAATHATGEGDMTPRQSLEEGPEFARYRFVVRRGRHRPNTITA